MVFNFFQVPTLSLISILLSGNPLGVLLALKTNDLLNLENFLVTKSILDLKMLLNRACQEPKHYFKDYFFYLRQIL